MSSTPAGWYDDGSGRQRWWDGEQWTDQFAETPPIEEAAPGLERGSPTTANSRPAGRSLLIGVVVGSLVIAAVAVAIGVAVNSSGGSGPASAPEASAPDLASLEPDEVVMEFHRARETADCDLFVQITTDLYRGEHGDCTTYDPPSSYFEDWAASEVNLLDVAVDGDTASIETSESYEVDGVRTSPHYIYGLVKQDGIWLINVYSSLGGE